MSRSDLIKSAFANYNVTDFISQADLDKILNLLYLKQLNKIVCFHQNGLITIYDAETHKPVKTFKAHCGTVTAYCYDNKKHQLITQYTGEIRIWDLAGLRFNQLAEINIEITRATSLELLKKKNRLVAAGEYRCWSRPEFFNTLFLVDIKEQEVIAHWKDNSVVLSMKKIRLSKGNYVIACGFANGYLKVFSCEGVFKCLRRIRAHSDRITKLHIPKIKSFQLCLTESDDQKIGFWNIKPQMIASLRSWTFPQKMLISGTCYNQKVLVLVQEHGTQAVFMNLLKGSVVKRIDVGVSTICRGLVFGRQPQVITVLNVSKFVYLGVKNDAVIPVS